MTFMFKHLLLFIAALDDYIFFITNIHKTYKVRLQAELISGIHP